MILTSGTTGTPKGAAAQATRSRSIRPWRCCREIPLKARQNEHVAAPLFHSWGFAHFTLGMLPRLDLRAAPEVRPGGRAWRGRPAPAPTSLAVVPVMMQRIMELPEETRRKYDVSSLKVVAASGSALPGDLANNWMDAVRREPLQPLRLDRGGLGHDRHARGHARRARHRRQAAARHRS